MSNLTFAAFTLSITSLVAYFLGWDYVQHVTFAGAIASCVLDSFVEDWKR